MSEEEKSPEEQLREATWAWATRLALTVVLIGAGYFGAYMQMGDAPQLRQEVKELQDRVVQLENQRETTSTQLAKAARDAEVCEKELKALKASR